MKLRYLKNPKKNMHIAKIQDVAKKLGPNYMFGVKGPRTYTYMIQLDKANKIKNSKTQLT